MRAASGVSEVFQSAASAAVGAVIDGIYMVAQAASGCDSRCPRDGAVASRRQYAGIACESRRNGCRSCWLHWRDPVECGAGVSPPAAGRFQKVNQRTVGAGRASDRAVSACSGPVCVLLSTARQGKSALLGQNWILPVVQVSGTGLFQMAAAVADAGSHIIGEQIRLMHYVRLEGVY